MLRPYGASRNQLDGSVDEGLGLGAGDEGIRRDQEVEAVELAGAGDGGGGGAGGAGGAEGAESTVRPPLVHRRLGGGRFSRARGLPGGGAGIDGVVDAAAEEAGQVV